VGGGTQEGIMGEMNPDRSGGGVRVFDPWLDLSNPELEINFESTLGGVPRVRTLGRWRLLLDGVQDT
jgi:hypothetical protein